MIVLTVSVGYHLILLHEELQWTATASCDLPMMVCQECKGKAWSTTQAAA